MSGGIRRALSGKEIDPARSRNLKLDPEDGTVRVAEMIAAQIEVEQSLSAHRIMWNLTFQGFTIAGYALVATADASAPARWIVQSLIAIVSIIVATATLFGIKAGEQQRSYLRRVWHDHSLSSYFPEPFSAPSGSTWGRSPASWICCVLIVMWLVLIPASLVLSGDRAEPTDIRVVAPLPVASD